MSALDRDALAQVARMLTATTGRSSPFSINVRLGCDRLDLVAELRAAGGHYGSAVYDAPTPYVIEWCEMEIEGVTFSASGSRPPSDSELARLADAETPAPMTKATLLQFTSTFTTTDTEAF